MRKVILSCIIAVLLSASCQINNEKILYKKAQKIVDEYHGNNSDLMEAASIFNIILQKNPKSVYGLIGIARVCYKSGYIIGDRYDGNALKKAEEILLKAIDIDSTNFDEYYYLCYVYLFEKDFVNARRMIYKAESIYPESPKINLLLAEINRLEKRYDESLIKAINVTQTTRDKNIKQTAYGIITGIYEIKNKSEEAELYYKKIIDLNESSPWVYYNYANFLARENRYDEAIVNYKKALGIMKFGAAIKQLGLAYYYKGTDLFRKEVYLSARKYFESSLRYYPNYSYSWYYLGMTYYFMGYKQRNVSELKKARLYLQKSIRIKNDLKMAGEQLSSLDNLLARLHVN